MTFKERLQEQLNSGNPSPFWRFCALMSTGKVVCPLTTPQIFERYGVAATPSKLFLDSYRDRGALNQILNIGVLTPDGSNISWARTCVDKGPVLDYGFHARKSVEVEGTVDANKQFNAAEGVRLVTEYLMLTVTYKAQVVATKIQDGTGCHVEALAYFEPESFPEVDARFHHETLEHQLAFVSRAVTRSTQMQSYLEEQLELAGSVAHWVDVIGGSRRRLLTCLSTLPRTDRDTRDKNKRIKGYNLKTEIAGLLVEAGYEGGVIKRVPVEPEWVNRVSNLKQRIDSFVDAYP